MEAGSYVFDVSPETFQTEVVEKSQQTPVLILFWADQVPPSLDTRRVLETLVARQQGKVLLGLVDVARDQALAQHLRVQGLPSLRVVKGGQLVHQLDGPQTETTLQNLIDELTLSPADSLRGALDQLLATGDYGRALQMLQQAVTEEPQNLAFKVELADVLILTGAVDDARGVLAGIPEDTEQRERPQTRLEVLEEAAGMPEVAELQAALQTALQQDSDDLELRYQLAVRLAAAGDYPQALDNAMAVLQADRTFRDDIGRLTMIRIFNLLGKGSDVAASYRRRMFAFMH
jgi:putative thioredoxin